MDYSGLHGHSTGRWNGFDRIDFAVEGRASSLILPPACHPSRPWIWRPTFLDAWPGADLALIRCGFHLAYTEVLDCYGSREGMKQGKALYSLLREAGLSRQFSFIALSRGGIFAWRYAALHPEQVACIYADAPVCDLRSWPAGRGRGELAKEEWAQLLQANQVSEEEALRDSFQPLNHLHPLAAAKIPILLVSGDADQVVPLEENSEKLFQNYRALGGDVRLIVKPGIGHHPHGLEDPRPAVDFVCEFAGISHFVEPCGKNVPR